MSRWIDWNKPAAGTARFLGKAVCVTVVVTIVTSYLVNRYGILFDPQLHQCLPGKRVYLLDRQARDIRQGDIAVFTARGLATWLEQAHSAARPLAAWYQDGRRMVKRVAGVPGDRVSVTFHEVRINGAKVGEGLDLAATLARPAQIFVREEVVPVGSYWLMGSTRDSFDSRYWGYVTADQIVGKAYPIF